MLNIGEGTGTRKQNIVVMMETQERIRRTGRKVGFSQISTFIEEVIFSADGRKLLFS